LRRRKRKKLAKKQKTPNNVIIIFLSRLEIPRSIFSVGVSHRKSRGQVDMWLGILRHGFCFFTSWVI